MVETRMNTRNERRINDTEERIKQKQPVAVLAQILIFLSFYPEKKKKLSTGMRSPNEATKIVIVH